MVKSRKAEWVGELYERASAVEAAWDEAYAAMNTADEDTAVARWQAAKSAFRARERNYVGRSYTTDCRRCGGAGGSDAWRATGWTCFDCGGHGSESVTYRAYRFRKDVRKQWREDEARLRETRAKDRAFADAVCGMGDVGVALVEAAARTWEADRAVDAGYYGDDMAVDRETRFRSELAWKLHRFGSLSEAQVAAVERGLEREREAAAKHERATAAGAFDGEMTVEATVVSVKWQDNRFGSGSTKKMLVELDDGRRAFGTVAASLDEVEHDDEGRHVSSTLVGKGDRVRFTATFEASKDDATFGFFKRPKRATVVARAEG